MYAIWRKHSQKHIQNIHSNTCGITRLHNINDIKTYEIYTHTVPYVRELEKKPYELLSMFRRYTKQQAIRNPVKAFILTFNTGTKCKRRQKKKMANVRKEKHQPLTATDTPK